MSECNFGDRVGVLQKADADTAWFVGWGTLEKDEVPPEQAGGLAYIARLMQQPTPVILLDSGEKVYGCECHWGSEDKIQKMLDKRQEVVHVTPSQLRGVAEDQQSA